MIRKIIIGSILSLSASLALAQTDNGNSISIGRKGINIENKSKPNKLFHVHFASLDLGFNALSDATDYNSAATQQYLQVPTDMRNTNLFDIKPVSSINVNIWPVMLELRLLQSSQHMFSLYTGAGTQIYNFKYKKNITYVNETTPKIIEDNVIFSKNKLAVAYISVPLMFNYKTRLGGDTWFTVGAGLIGGYAYDVWTKQISDERGKQKNSDAFNIDRFNLNFCGEIGVTDIIRFFGTYQLNNLYTSGLNQHPYSIGIRFFGL